MSRLQNPPFVIGMPTETVYGLAARIDSEQGIAAIFRLKERPFFDPLIVHVASIDQARALTSDWTPVADILVRRFWPGPLTLVLPKDGSINPMITSGLDTVGLRMPRHPKALELIESEGVPLAAPSANKFGKTSPTSAAHVLSEFGSAFEVIDGGECEVGLESTVLSLVQKGTETEATILRPGAISRSAIDKVVRVRWRENIDKRLAPGQMKHHYMPAVPLIFVRNPNEKIETLKETIRQKFSELPKEIDGVRIIQPNLSLHNIRTLELAHEGALAARQFYSRLRELAEKKPDLIIFYQETHHHGEDWEALFDRLTKAASLVV